MFLLLLFALNRKNSKMTWHSKKLKTFQLYLYSIFFSELFFFWENKFMVVERKSNWPHLLSRMCCCWHLEFSMRIRYDIEMGEKFSTENNWSLRNLLHLPGMEWAEGCNISLGVCRKGKNVKQTRRESLGRYDDFLYEVLFSWKMDFCNLAHYDSIIGNLFYVTIRRKIQKETLMIIWVLKN